MSAGNLHVEARDRDIIVTMPDTSSGWCIEGLIGVPISWRGSTIFNMRQKGPITRAQFLARARKLANDKARELGGLCKKRRRAQAVQFEFSDP